VNPIDDFLFNPKPDIGGAIVPIVGMPGSGKTIGLTNIGLENLDSGNTVLWRGTKQCQWVHFLANDTKIVLWNHEAINNFEAFITAEDGTDDPDPVDLSQHGVEIREWSEPQDILDNVEPDAVNVINVPGLENNEQKDLYFFRKQWIDVFDALIERRSGDMICFLFDEIGDVIPSQQQLRKPYYKLVAEFLPPKLSQMRKKRVLLYGAAHATHDTHYFFWKIKANSLCYMSNAVVKNNVTPSVDQADVNSLGRGEFIFPPKREPVTFALPYLADSLDWIPDRDSALLAVDWTADIPDLLSDGDNHDDDTTSRLSKSQKAKLEYLLTDKTLRECGEEFDVKKQTVSQAELPSDYKDIVERTNT